jgi:hypothetical protein
MTPQQAQRAVELLGGNARAAGLVINTLGQPLDRSALTKILKRDSIPAWLSEQLAQKLREHAQACLSVVNQVA